MNPDQNASPRDAATLIVLRDTPDGPRVLMGRRDASAVFMPSKYVFPGGRVDGLDRSIALARPLSSQTRAQLLQDAPDTSPEALAICAVRELWEETGLILGQPGAWPDPPAEWRAFADQGLVPAAHMLRLVCRAVTPREHSRRFDARFFLAPAEALHNDPDHLCPPDKELTDLQWVPLAQARRLNVPFITTIVLAEVSKIIAEKGATNPDGVPFFDNRSPQPVFTRLTGDL